MAKLIGVARIQACTLETQITNLGQAQSKDSLGEKQTQGARDGEREREPFLHSQALEGISALTLIPPRNP